MSKIQTFEITGQPEPLVRVGNEYFPHSEATARCYDKDIVFPLAEPMHNLLTDQESLLFTKQDEDPINPISYLEYVADNGISVCHVEEDLDHLGYVALGAVCLKGEDIVVAEVLSYRGQLSPSFTGEVVTSALHELDFDSANVSVFVPMLRTNHWLDRIFKRQSNTNEQDVCGYKMIATLQSGSLSEAFGQIEPLDHFRDRIG